MFAIILMIVVQLTPNISDAGLYILTDKMGWSSFDVSFNSLIASIVFALGMLAVLNLVKTASFKVMSKACCLAIVVSAILLYRFHYYKKIKFNEMFVL